MPETEVRRIRGAVNHHAGLAAEGIVERAITARGLTIAARRWKGPGGEVDLICRDGATVVFIEVKKAATHARAAAAFGVRQYRRIAHSAQAFVEGEPAGQLTDVRIDLALVDAAGVLRIEQGISFDC